MTCPECDTEMDVYEEHPEDDYTVYECPNCGHIETVSHQPEGK